MAKGAAGGIVGPTVRISPIELRTSQQLRLRRLHPRSVWKEDSGQLVVPVPTKGLGPSGPAGAQGLELVTWVIDLLRNLVPVEAAAPPTT